MKQILFSMVFALLAQSALADVVVPVPDDIGTVSGTLQVNGEPGPGQEKTVSVISCISGADGAVVKFGCNLDKMQNYQLGQPISIPSGKVIIMYGNNFELVDVAPRKTTVVNLQKIIVPANRTANFIVFVDLTNPAMQDKFTSEFWIADNSGWVSQNCKSKDKKIQMACHAFASGDYHNLKGPFVTYSPDGSYSTLDSDSLSFVNQGRLKVVDPKSGDFVSVLPGVYAIEFQDPVTNKKQTQYGITVQ